MADVAHKAKRTAGAGPGTANCVGVNAAAVHRLLILAARRLGRAVEAIAALPRACHLKARHTLQLQRLLGLCSTTEREGGREKTS